MEDCGVDGVAIGARGERAWRIAEQLDDPERRTAHARAGLFGVEYPDVRPADPRRVQLGVSGAGNFGNGRVSTLLAAVRGRDERPALGEDDVARFIADEERARHERHPGFARPGTRQRLRVDDADRIREMVDDPGFGRIADCDGDRFQAHGDGGCVREGAGIADREDLEPVVGRVDGVEHAPVGRQRHGTHGARLERDEVGRVRRREVECTRQCKPGKAGFGQAHGQRDAAFSRWRHHCLRSGSDGHGVPACWQFETPMSQIRICGSTHVVPARSAGRSESVGTEV